MRDLSARWFVIPLALAFGACADSTTEPAVEPLAVTAESPGSSNAAPTKGESTIVQLALADERFATLASVLTPDLVAALSGTDQFTVFAPTNDAFADLDGFLQTNFGIGIGDLSPDQIETVLLYHATDGRRAANSVVPPRNEREIDTLLGEPFFVQTDLSIEDGVSPTGLRADPAIEEADISASNGIIHAIDQVLVPPSIVAALVGS